MTESTDSINNEVNEEDIKKLTQKISGVKTQDLLKAISSESESTRLSCSKLSNQFAIGSYSSKHSKPGSDDVLHTNIDNPQLPSDMENTLTCPFTPDNVYTSCKETDEPTMDSLRTDPSMLSNKSSHNYTQQANDAQQDVVPESVYSILQQKAQNVLRMIAIESDAIKSPEVTFPQANELSNISETLSASQASSHQSILKKSTESANLKNSKTSSYQSSSNLSEVKSSTKSNENAFVENKGSMIKEDSITKNISYTTVPQNQMPVVEDTSTTSDTKTQTLTPCFRTSESQQSNRSTEQCTTDYCFKNNSGSENVFPKEAAEIIADDKSNSGSENLIPTENSEVSSDKINYGSENNLPKKVSEIIAKDSQKIDGSQTTKLSQQCYTTNEESENENVSVPNEMGCDAKHPENDVIKEISQIIDSNEVPVELTKQGERIRQLFKQRFLVKLEANGTLDKQSEEVASNTATKFAKWMEDILKEVDTRKKTSDQKTPVSDLKDIKEEKEHDDEFVSAPSSKESITNDVSQMSQTEEPLEKNQDESPEIIKIQELSDSELIEQFGTHLLKDSKHELFQFIGPDNVPVEVRHLTTVESKKVMVVKKKTAETQWSNWVIEVGPEVTLESVSGSVSQKINNEDKENKLKEIVSGIWNVNNFPWQILKPKVTQRKIPILKKQCVLTEADIGVEYPIYPFIAPPYEKVGINSTIVKSHQAEPSPNFN